MHVMCLNFSSGRNMYVFNPSLAHLSEDTFLLVYRVIHYDLHADVDVHPWKMWCDATRLISKYRPDMIRNGRVVTPCKYRRELGADACVAFDGELCVVRKDAVEMDGTGACLLHIHEDASRPRVAIGSMLSSVFRDEMNQDCRVQWNAGRLMLTYNGFIRHDEGVQACMLTRDVYFHARSHSMYVSSERYCCNGYVSRFGKRTEKNWSYVCDEEARTPRYVYSLAGSVALLDVNSGHMWHTCSRILNDIHTTFGRSLLLSLGTPTQRWRSGWLSVGHAKLEYGRATSPRAVQFVRDLKRRYGAGMRMHGKYVYLMFAILLDDGMTLTHMSNAFIPTDRADTHLPYSLVFPCGLHVSGNDSIIVSYGEGDTRSKLLFLSATELQRLLIPAAKLTAENYDFYVMDNAGCKVQVFGYYHRHNTGDDCFSVVLRYLNDAYWKGSIKFSNPYDVSEIDNDTDTVIIGGGDIINPYFIDKIKALMEKHGGIRRALVVSVGTPYLDCIPAGYLDFAHHVMTRNERDVSFLASKTRAPVEFYPDMVHLLSTALRGTVPPEVPAHQTGHGTRIKLGFCLTRTMYHKKYEKEYFDLLCKYADVVELLVRHENCSVALIPFGINRNNDKENDTKLNQQLATLLRDTPHVTCVEPTDECCDTSDPSKYAAYLDALIGELDVAVCARFHAHVICLNHCVPVVSVATTRKVRELMHQWQLQAYQFPMAVSELYSPIDMNAPSLYTTIVAAIRDRHTIRKFLRKHKTRVDACMLRFVDKLNALVGASGDA